jgi:hypothetical protein
MADETDGKVSLRGQTSPTKVHHPCLYGPCLLPTYTRPRHNPVRVRPHHGCFSQGLSKHQQREPYQRQPLCKPPLDVWHQLHLKKVLHHAR